MLLFAPISLVFFFKSFAFASALGVSEDGVHAASESGEEMTGYRRGWAQGAGLRATAAGVWREG